MCEKNGILKKILLWDKYYLKIFNVNKINQLNQQKKKYIIFKNNYYFYIQKKI